MRMVSADDTRKSLDFPSLVPALEAAFAGDAEVPVRHHHSIPRPGEQDATLLLMPAWDTQGPTGIKIVRVTPGNAERGLPAIMGVYLLMNEVTGEPEVLIDGQMLTVRRTAAASALGAHFLARADSSRLLMVGTGALAPHLIEAHASVRPIREVKIWGRNPDKAADLARSLDGKDMEVEAVEELQAGVEWADVISCATLSREPLVRGAWMQEGQHLDLVGAFKPDMRETDDAAVQRCRIFVDTHAGALKEGGDIVQPLEAGAIGTSDVVADLFELSRGEIRGRQDDRELTLFKSVGTALEDYAAAQQVLQRLS